MLSSVLWTGTMAYASVVEICICKKKKKQQQNTEINIILLTNTMNYLTWPMTTLFKHPVLPELNDIVARSDVAIEYQKSSWIVIG